MATAQGVIYVLVDDRTFIFRVEGRATMVHSLPLRRYAEQCLAAGATTLRVDLRGCAYLDSTFLGTLLFLKKAAERREAGGFGLLSPSPACCRLLEQMDLEAYFPVVLQEPPAAAEWSELKCDSEDVGEFQRNVVRAHEELASLAGPAGDPFRELAHRLASEVEGKTVH